MRLGLAAGHLDPLLLVVSQRTLSGGHPEGGKGRSELMDKGCCMMHAMDVLHSNTALFLLS